MRRARRCFGTSLRRSPRFCLCAGMRATGNLCAAGSRIAQSLFNSPVAATYEELMSETKRARAMGFNHVALEVGDIDEALSFYSRIFEFKLRGKSENMAFIDLGDQFLALQKGRSQSSDGGRHFGLVVDDKEASAKH